MSGGGATFLGLLLAAAAALTTATAHALLKSGEDKLAIRALIGMTGLAVMAAPAAYAGLPDASYAGWLFAASALHVVYQLVLIRSYQASDFSVAFPVARGVVPLATATLAAVAFGERLPAATLAGIALVSLGIVAFASGGMTRRGLALAFVAGLLTTAYTLVDAKGVRAAPSGLAFIAWFFVLDGLVLPVLFVAMRGRSASRTLRTHARVGIGAGLVSLVAFGSTLGALRLAPVGAVSAIRETSVLVALLIAPAMLGERLDPRRICCGTAIALGAVSIVAGIAR